jgi:ParB-like chromosome segregation protein Spo0J
MARQRSSGALPTPDPGKPVFIDLDQLTFDPENPRVVEQLGPRPSQASIQRLLVQGDMKALDLVPSFVANGYIPYEPLIVKPSGNKYVVVEGNRRLAVLRYLQTTEDPDETAAFRTHNLQQVPCLVFTGDERQLLAYLGLRHLSKTKDWSTNAKGNFVERILHTGLTLAEAGRITNTTTGSLRQILLTRRMFDAAAGLGLSVPSPTQAEGETLFWHLGDALRRTNTKNYLDLEESDTPLERPTFNETHFERLITWLYGNSKTKQGAIINSIRDIPALNECLGSERATKALENGLTLQDAIEELQAGGAKVTAHLERAKKSVQRATGEIADVDKEGYSEVETSANDLKATVDQLEDSLKARKKRLQL